MIICVEHFLCATYGVSHLCFSRARIVEDLLFTPTGVTGGNPVNTRLVTAVAEDSIRQRLGALGRGALDGAGTASGGGGAATAGVDTALSARKVVPRAQL